MVRGKTFVRSFVVLSPFMILGLVFPGCGGGDTSGGQVQDLKPEVRQQVQETISKGYTKDYRAKYAGKRPQ